MKSSKIHPEDLKLAQPSADAGFTRSVSESQFTGTGHVDRYEFEVKIDKNCEEKTYTLWSDQQSRWKKLDLHIRVERTPTLVTNTCRTRKERSERIGHVLVGI